MTLKAFILIGVAQVCICANEDKASWLKIVILDHAVKKDRHSHEVARGIKIMALVAWMAGIVICQQIIKIAAKMCLAEKQGLYEALDSLQCRFIAAKPLLPHETDDAMTTRTLRFLWLPETLNNGVNQQDFFVFQPGHECHDWDGQNI